MTSQSPVKKAAHRAAPSVGSARLSILIADRFEASGIEQLEALGCQVSSQPGLTAETLAEAMTAIDPGALIVRSTKVPGAALEAASRLSLIIRAGAGYDNIDVATASARGIFVANCPGKNAVAVAELTWGLILACDRRLDDQFRDLREGRWDKKGYAKARGVFGRTLGIVGLGRIGLAVAERGTAFGMPVIAWSRSLTQERAEALGIGFCRTPIEVAERADVISINVASTPETKHLVGVEFCQALRDGAYLINTSRGAVVDDEALVAAIQSKGLRVGLDVYNHQPAPTDMKFEDPIVHEPGVVGTHHCGASTDQAQQAIAAETVRIVSTYARTGEVPNCVNRAAASPATCLLTVRHLNRPGVLAHIFHTLSDAGINVEEMENIIYEGAKAACGRIQLDDRPTGGQIDMMKKNPNVLSVDVTEVPS